MFTKTLSALTLTASLTLSPAAQAANWFPFGAGLDGSQFSIDLDSGAIRGGTVLVWVQHMATDASSTVILSRIDCEHIRVQTLELVTYTPAGAVTGHWTTPRAPWESVVPGTMHEVLRNTVCFLRERVLQARTPPASVPHPTPIPSRDRPPSYDM